MLQIHFYFFCVFFFWIFFSLEFAFIYCNHVDFLIVFCNVDSKESIYLMQLFLLQVYFLLQSLFLAVSVGTLEVVPWPVPH